LRFSLVDALTKKSVRLEVRKDSSVGSHMEIVKCGPRGTEKPIAVISAKNGKISVSSGDEVNMESDEDIALQVEPDLDEGALRNWKITAKKIVVTNPVTRATVELPRKKGAPKTPTEEVPDILGQHEMVFTVAFGLATGKHTMLIGPTGTGKTSIYRWFAKQLGWNLVLASIARGTEAAHLVGEYLPTGPATFEWMDGPVSEAVRLSQRHPTILVFDELNRIGNIAEFSRVYSVLDDQRRLDLQERRMHDGTVETIECGELFIGATSNPSDDEAADYVGVQDLDPALMSRFPFQPNIGYPPLTVEAKALTDRVPDLELPLALKMCTVAKHVRESAEVHFPLSFRELEAWALACPKFGYEEAARVAVVNKAPRVFRESLEGLLALS
jgi:MoxR-like ATPase